MLLTIQILRFLLSIVLSLFCMLTIIRFYMQIAKISFANPIGQGVIKLTNWLVLPLQRILPRLKVIDLPSFLAAYLCSLIHVFLLMFIGFLAAGALQESGLLSIQGMAYTMCWAMLNLIRMTVYILSAIIFVRVIFSWVQPSTPSSIFIRHFIYQMSAPLIDPLQKRLPSLGGLDFSPFIALILLQIILMVVNYFMPFQAMY